MLSKNFYVSTKSNLLIKKISSKCKIKAFVVLKTEVVSNRLKKALSHCKIYNPIALLRILDIIVLKGYYNNCHMSSIDTLEIKFLEFYIFGTLLLFTFT